MEGGIQGRDFKLIVFRELSRIGKALSDPKRLELLDLLCQSEKSVDHVARQLGASIATVSHHLQILKASHLATERRSGRFIHYQASEMGKAVWKCLADIGAVSIGEVSSAVSQFFEKDRIYEPLDLKDLRRKVDGGRNPPPGRAPRGRVPGRPFPRCGIPAPAGPGREGQDDSSRHGSRRVLSRPLLRPRS